MSQRNLVPDRCTEVDFAVPIFIGDCRDQCIQVSDRFTNRLYDDAATLLAHIDRLIQPQLGRRHHWGGNANGGTVAPFLYSHTHGFHRIDNVDTRGTAGASQAGADDNATFVVLNKTRTMI